MKKHLKSILFLALFLWLSACRSGKSGCYDFSVDPIISSECHTPIDACLQIFRSATAL